jgi:hypothetical protein
LSIFGIVFGSLSCLGCRKSYLLYGDSIQKYHKFLLEYEETPRSKMVKKYLPPLEPLLEATSAHEKTLSVISMQ